MADAVSCHLYCTREGGTCLKFSLECPFEILHLSKLVVAPAPQKETFYVLGECLDAHECFEWEVDVSGNFYSLHI